MLSFWKRRYHVLRCVLRVCNLLSSIFQHLTFLFRLQFQQNQFMYFRFLHLRKLVVKSICLQFFANINHVQLVNIYCACYMLVCVYL
uniref:Putative ovule protein n=1 Tax=Solanum chacoense TaxID=4108 RepID=A0A0V0HAW5_SOLCH